MEQTKAQDMSIESATNRYNNYKKLHIITMDE